MPKKKKRPPTCQKRKAESLVGSRTDPVPVAAPDHTVILDIFPELETAGQDQLGFSDSVYQLASVVFQNNHLERPATHRLVIFGKERGLPLPDVKEEEVQCAAFELAFNTLKYQEMVEYILIDRYYGFTRHMSTDQMSLVAVLLFDFQDRKFLPRKRKAIREVIQEVRDVENCLLRHKTRLAASLARYRIKYKLPSIEFILPESMKTKEWRSKRLPLYAWVNTLKSSLDEVQQVLKSEGFLQVKSIGQLEGQTFCRDSHCGDILVLPAHMKTQLCSTKLLTDHKIVIQDKSYSLGPNVVCSLLPEEGDVLMVGCFSGLTVSHTASLIAQKHKASGNYQPTVYVCVSNCTNTQRAELQKIVITMGCNNVKLIPEDFLSLYGHDKRFQRLCVILLTPKCSMSAVSNPIEVIVTEKGDTDLLQDLSQDTISQSKLAALVAQQRKDIDHALKFPKVLSVVYSTCSSYPEENEEVVNKALEQVKTDSEKQENPKHTLFRLSPSPFSIPEHTEGPGKKDPFFMLEPSKENNGCFLAVFSREAEPVIKETPHEVILRAKAKGILDRIGSNHQITGKEPHVQTMRVKKKTHSYSSQHSSSLSIQSKNDETRGRNNATSLGQQETSKRQQLTQGKAKPQLLQASKPASCSFSSSNRESSSSSSSKPGGNISKKNITSAFSITTFTSNSHSPPPPPPAPPGTRRAPSVRTCRAPHQDMLKRMALALPIVQFPPFIPPQHRQNGFDPGFDTWSPVQTIPIPDSEGIWK